LILDIFKTRRDVEKIPYFPRNDEMVLKDLLGSGHFRPNLNGIFQDIKPRTGRNVLMPQLTNVGNVRSHTPGPATRKIFEEFALSPENIAKVSNKGGVNLYDHTNSNRILKPLY